MRSPFSLALFLFCSIMLNNLRSEEQKPVSLDHSNGTWHVGLENLWGYDASRKESKRLDIYPVFENGKWVNALATARRFNTSIHLIEESDVRVDAEKKTLTGTITVLLTPDTWVPADGQPYRLEVQLDGELLVQPDGKVQVGGKYKSRRIDGGFIYDDKTEVEGKLIGGVGKTETGWDDSVWSFPLNQVIVPGEIDLDLQVIHIGVADGKVNWGTIGQTAQAKWGAHKAYPISVENFEPVSATGIARGYFVVSGRQMHPGGDPAKQYRFDFTGYRVQGLAGGKATITELKYGQLTANVRNAYGKGSCQKGGGATPRVSLWRGELNEAPWYVSVAGYKPISPGEHPRLLFRKDDLPKLRKRAETHEGQAIVKRLRHLLGNNGEALPDHFNTTPTHNHNKSPQLARGTFTTWHAAGFGFLYQLTGDKKYAELARGCAQFMLDGKIDIDNRYAWSEPGTDLRCGSVLAAMAYAYDLCYDAWPADFRSMIALEIQNFDKVTASSRDDWAERVAKAQAEGQSIAGEPKRTSIKELVGRTGYPPGSNHYGSLFGGTAVALLSIQGDPGVDTPTVTQRLEEAESNIPRMLELGFGDAGWYAEGLPPSRLSANGGLIELLHALRVAAGRDYIESPRQNAQWITLRWIMHLCGSGWANYPNRGIYGGDEMFGRSAMLSHTGDICTGFGTISPKYRGALLWTYNRFVKEGEDKNWGDGMSAFNANCYPHRAIFAFLNWPLDEPEQNPAEVLPRAVVDRDHGYFIARNRWEDQDDIVVTQLLENGPKGYYRAQDGKKHTDRPGTVRIWGYGLRTQMTTSMGEGIVTHYEAKPDGSFSMTAKQTGFAVDFSKASGAEVVVVAWGRHAFDGKNDKPAKNEKASTNLKQLKVGNETVYVFTLQTGASPEIVSEGDKLKVGNRIFSWDGAKITAQ